MVRWTDIERSTIGAVWGQVDIDEIGPEIVARLLIVYPWTERYFGAFGDLFTVTAILANPKVAHHGKVVLMALDKAVQNMDNIKDTFAALSLIHCDKLGVDPENFRLMADCITIAVACKLRTTMDHQVQAIWQKFLSVVVEAMTSQYH